MAVIEVEQHLARTLAASPYPLAWFEAYPSVIYKLIKQLRKGN
jgi:hypothetical protein